MKKALTNTAIVIGVGLVALAAIVVLIYFLQHPTLAEWRDITLIALGFFLMLFAILLVGVAAALLGLINVARTLLPDLLNKASSTAETVRGTTGFVSERVVSPVIKVSAAAAGARAAAQSFVRRGNDGK